MAEAETVAVSDSSETPVVETPKTGKTKLPEIKEVLRAGVQFGHESKRWNPQMAKYIFGKKNNIHIIDIAQTLPLLEKAGDFLAEAYVKGPILFVGTKRQASAIIEKAAVESGAHFVTTRWAGGLMTNFELIKTSVARLNSLEKQFDEGVSGRTKYEVNKMKKEWERLSRLYSGIKTMTQKPAAVFIVDPVFESGAARECNKLGMPVVAIMDTNGDPRYIDFPIPANDDAIKSLTLLIEYLAARLKAVATTHRAVHSFKDYKKVEIKIKKIEENLSTEPEAVVVAKLQMSEGESMNAVSSTPMKSVNVKSVPSKSGKEVSKAKAEKTSEKAVKEAPEMTTKKTTKKVAATKSKSKTAEKEATKTVTKPVVKVVKKASSEEQSGILGKYQTAKVNKK